MFVKIVLTVKKACSSNHEKFKAEGQEFAIFFGSLEQFILIVKGLVRTNFEAECFLTCACTFLESNTLEEIIGIQKLTGKVRQISTL